MSGRGGTPRTQPTVVGRLAAWVRALVTTAGKPIRRVAAPTGQQPGRPVIAGAVGASAASGRQAYSPPKQYPDQKLEALGRLTGGVAHEFNNLLMIVLSNASLLRHTAESQNDTLAARLALNVEAAAQRGGRLAAQLLAYAQNQMLRPESLSVYDVLSGVHDLLSRAAGEAVQMRLLGASDLWQCRVDSRELQSAILNLVLNAQDAMPSGGVLTITCDNQRVDAEVAAMTERRAGRYVRVAVADTGVGIPPHLHQRVFEPFFTTKPVGSGSGLGLAQVHGFAGQSGGWVELTSVPGQGTTVALLLPCTEPISAVAASEPTRRAPPGGQDNEVRSVSADLASSEQLHAELRGRLAMPSTHQSHRRAAALPIVHNADLAGVPPTGSREGTVCVGVVPLKPIGGADANGFSVGLADELSTALSRFRWIGCVAPASVAAMADEAATDVSAWRLHGLDYLLEGSFRRADDRIRITIRLINLRQRGEISWSKRFDSDLTDILGLQDRIAADIAAQVAPELLVWESETVAARPRVHANSYELMLCAIPAVYRLDQAGFREAGPLLRQALAVNPENAAAHAWLAHWYMLLVGQGWADDPAPATQRAEEHARRAIMLDPNDARGLTVLGHVEAFLRRRPVHALRLHAQALELNPNFALAWCYSGLANSYVGRHATAIEHIRRAHQLSPHDPHRFFFDTSMIMPLLLTGDYQNAAQIGRRAVEANPSLSSAYKGLLATVGLMGRTNEARALRGRLAAIEPNFTIHDAVARSPLIRPEDLQRYADGLRLAGCAERPRAQSLLDSWRPGSRRRQRPTRADEMAD